MTTDGGEGQVSTVVVDCPLCCGPDADWLHWARDRWMGGGGAFRYARCRGCGASYLRIRPSVAAMDRHYPKGYIRAGRGPWWLRSALRRLDLAPRARLATRQPGRRLLDVGCARGDFMVEMRRRGWIVAGVEPTTWLADEALGRGLVVWPEPVARAPLPAGAFDVATLWDVLEHLEAPEAALRRVGAALRPGGRLIVNVPLADGWDARLFGRRWAGWDAPRHLVVFTRATLADTLRRAGYEVLGTARVFETYLITALSLGLLAREHLPRSVAHLAWAGLHARGTRLAMVPVFSGLDRVLGPSSLAIVAEWRGR